MFCTSVCTCVRAPVYTYMGRGISRLVGNWVKHTSQLYPIIIPSEFRCFTQLYCHYIPIISHLPTKYAILRQLRWLVNGMSTNHPTNSMAHQWPCLRPDFFPTSRACIHHEDSSESMPKVSARAWRWKIFFDAAKGGAAGISFFYGI